MGTIVAIGGYAFESQADEKIETPISIDRTILEFTNKKTPNVLFIPTASNDSKDYVKSIENIYRKNLKTNFDTLMLYSSSIKTSEIRDKVEWADVIYVGGGNTLMMMKKWRRLGVDRLLKKAYIKGKILCGVSAGSICWFDFGVSDSLHFYNQHSNEYIKVSGSGILSGVNCPHFGSKLWDKGHRTLGMEKIMKRSKGKCIAIGDGAAVVFNGKKRYKIGDGAAVECYWKNGELIKEAIDAF